MKTLWDYVVREYLPLLEIVWPSLVAALAVALAAGVQGVFVVLRRQTLLVLSIPQLVMLGAALALRHVWPALPTALGVVLVALLLIAWSRKQEAANLLLPAFYVMGTSLTILVVANAGAHLHDVQNMFTGIDVAVEEKQALILLIIMLAICLVTALLWRRWLLISQAPAAAELAWVKPKRWNALFLILLAATLVLSTQAMGVVLVLTLFFLPAATVLPWARRVPVAMVLSVVAAILFVMIGFVLSTEMNWPLSQSIGGAGAAIFLLSYLLAQVMGSRAGG